MIRSTAAALLIAVTACGGASTPTGAPAPTSGAASASDTSVICEARSGRIDLDTAEGTRTAEVVVPGDVPPEEGWPVLIALHGHGGSATLLDTTSGIGAAGAAAGFVVVLPDARGEPARWNFDHRPDEPDDEAFLAALVEHLAGTACADRSRIVLVGSSNGAAFAGVAACGPGLAGAVVAVVMVIATVPASCPANVRPSVLTVRGTADAHVPYEGGGGAAALAGTWADHAGCDPTPDRVTGPAVDVERTTWTGCTDGATVALDTWVGGTHRWPVAASAGRYSATPAVVGFASAAIESAR